LKWTVITDVNITDTNALVGMFGNNGYYNANKGIVIAVDSSSTNTSLTALVCNGAGGAQPVGIAFTSTTALTLGSAQILTVKLDNSLIAAGGKFRAYDGITAHDATATGTGVLGTGNASTRFQIMDMGTSGGLDASGSMRFVCILGGVETDAKLAKLQSDIATITGTAL
jgi:hypothetical protein